MLATKDIYADILALVDPDTIANLLQSIQLLLYGVFLIAMPIMARSMAAIYCNDIVPTSGYSKIRHVRYEMLLLWPSALVGLMKKQPLFNLKTAIQTSKRNIPAGLTPMGRRQQGHPFWMFQGHQ